MAEIVYILCAVTSLTCAVMLFRAYRDSRFKLLFWSGICFMGFAVSNAVLVIDLVVLPVDIDLSIVRTIPALLGVMTLVYGLVWEST